MKKFKEIKSLPTKYKNHTFRSRLEARWAVFFDTMGIEWEYEAEGYNLNGEWYLPDFWLPKLEGGIHCEVKHKNGDFTKAYKFTKNTGKQIWLCPGPPEPRVYKVLYWNDEGNFVDHWEGTPMWDQARDDDRFFYDPGYQEKDGTYSEDYYDCGTKYMRAVEAANTYKFNT